MRLLVSLAISILLVGVGYLVVERFTPNTETVERGPTPIPPPPRKPKPIPVQPPPPASPPPAENPAKAAWTDVEKRVLELTNAARREAHVPALLPDDGLRECAVAQSLDMIVRGFFDHVNPSGENPSDRVGRLDRVMIGAAGENIWEGAGESYAHTSDLGSLIVDAWMHSPHHRENILRPSFTHLGVGVVIRGNEVRATQSFETVRAYLNRPLDKIVRSGSPLDLSTRGPSPSPELYDLVPTSETHRSPGNKPSPITEAAANAPPGDYRLRLYFRTSTTGFSILSGPSLTITQ